MQTCACKVERKCDGRCVAYVVSQFAFAEAGMRREQLLLEGSFAREGGTGLRTFHAVRLPGLAGGMLGARRRASCSCGTSGSWSWGRLVLTVEVLTCVGRVEGWLLFRRVPGRCCRPLGVRCRASLVTLSVMLGLVFCVRFFHLNAVGVFCSFFQDLFK